jgi:hypothetical protein
MRMSSRLALAAVLCGLSACAAPPPAAPVASAVQVDPQVMSDVIDWAFPLGGSGMLRNMRVGRWVSSIQAVDCGGKPFENLDYTNDRLDQAMYPDLSLIREKGLSESGPRPAGERVGEEIACRYKSLPSWNKVFNLSVDYWRDRSYEALDEPTVKVKLDSAGTCLEGRTGWNLTHANASKLEYFFVKVDGVDAQAANEEASRDLSRRYSTIFAECSEAYSTAMQAALEAKRPAAIERNRELLTTFAGELAQAGYVP